MLKFKKSSIAITSIILILFICNFIVYLIKNAPSYNTFIILLFLYIIIRTTQILLRNYKKYSKLKKKPIYITEYSITDKQI